MLLMDLFFLRELGIDRRAITALDTTQADI